MFNNFLLEKLILPFGDLLQGTSFMKELNFWRNEVDKMDAGQLHQLQKQRLNFLLGYSIKTIPFYQQQNIQLSGDPYNDIKSFSIMHKKLLKENIDKMYVGNKSKMVVEKSSGSSGIQGEVYMTLEENRRYQAAQTYLWEWSGYKIGEPLLQTGITPNRGLIKSIKDKLFRTQYVDAYQLSDEKMVEELNAAKTNKRKYFGGYASSLNVFAETAIKAEINLKFNAVMSWGDKLFDHYKTNIQKAFGNPLITELYGTTEGFVISATCKEGSHHQLSPQTFIELLDKDGNEVQPGETGFVVVTRLDAFSFPLIRYYLGDIAVKEEPSVTCKCGKAFPLLKKIIGRDTDIVHTPTGKALIVHFFTGTFEHVEEIRQFRVIQRINDEIEIEYIATDNFKPDILEKLSAMMFAKAHEQFTIKYIPVEFIAATASGKPQIIQNLIANRLI